MPDETKLLEKSWMVSNHSFAFPDDHVVAGSTGHILGGPSDRIEHLRSRWIDCITTIITHTFWSQAPIKLDLSQVPTSDIWFRKIVSMYSSESRHYHTLCHLEEMFGYIDICVDRHCCRVPRNDMAVINMAVYFHDLVYNPQSSTNEEDSVESFRQFYKELLSDTWIRSAVRFDEDESLTPIWNGYDRVIQYIVATKSHTALTTTSEPENYNFFFHLFLDSDMSVLGKDEDSYNIYASLIRKEYAFVPHAIYCEKRSQVLRSFLDQSIFKTEFVRLSLENRARLNIQREIELLENGIIPS